MLERTQEAVRVADLDNVELLEGEMEAVPLPADVIDLMRRLIPQERHGRVAVAIVVRVRLPETGPRQAGRALPETD